MATWAIGLIVTVALAVAAVVLGDEYNVLEQLNLPALPVGDETLATGGLIALAAIVVGSLLAAMLGGKLGERYHKKVDRIGFVDEERFASRPDGYAEVIFSCPSTLFFRVMSTVCSRSLTVTVS